MFHKIIFFRQVRFNTDFHVEPCFAFGTCNNLLWEEFRHPTQAENWYFMKKPDSTIFDPPHTRYGKRQKGTSLQTLPQMVPHLALQALGCCPDAGNVAAFASASNPQSAQNWWHCLNLKQIILHIKNVHSNKILIVLPYRVIHDDHWTPI